MLGNDYWFSNINFDKGAWYSTLIVGRKEIDFINYKVLKVPTIQGRTIPIIHCYYENKEFIVANFHLESKNNLPTRTAQLDQLIKELQTRLKKNKNIPIIIGGDTNFIYENDWKNHKLLYNAGFKDSILSYKSTIRNWNENITMHTEYCNIRKDEGKLQRLDRFYYINSEVISCELFGLEKIPNKDYYPSDHPFLYLEIQI